MKHIVLFFAFISVAGAQVLSPAAPREYVYDGRLYARNIDADTVVLMSLPAMSAVTDVYIIAEDTLWSLSDIVTVRSGNPDAVSFVVWDPEQSGIGDCYGCIATDWLFTAGTIYYTKQPNRVVAQLTGMGGDVRGTLRIVVKWVELY